MGFRDFECFNKALLAKQGWRLITKPNSLLARIFKERYYRDGSFLTAGCPRMASYTWRSIVWAKETLVEGLRWRVGDGRSIAVYRDPWLLRESTFRVISKPGDDPNLLVHELLDPSKQWDVQKIERLLHPADVQAIISIPLPASPQQDRMIWHYDKRGEYVVRSGYKLALDQKNVSSMSNPEPCLKWWKALWGLALPPKVKIFIWKSYFEWIPTRVNLINRGMKIESSCPICAGDSEHMMHVFWYCRSARKVWQTWTRMNIIKPERNWRMKDFFFHAFRILQKSDFLLFCVILWMIWHNRNCSVFGNKRRPENQILEWATNFVEDYEGARKSKNIGGRRETNINNESEDGRWIPPRRGIYQVNVDAGFKQANGCFSTGAVIRDHQGRALVAGHRRYNWSASVSTGETVAIRDGVFMALEEDLTPFVIISDSKVAVDNFNSTCVPMNDAGLFVQDCKSFDTALNCLGVEYAPRNSNRVAHSLAKRALREPDCNSRWRDQIPPDIAQIVLADFAA